MKYKAVLFDMDGTVMNTLADLADSVNYCLSRFNFPVRTVDEVRSFLGNGSRYLIEHALPAGTDPAVTEELLAFYMPWYEQHCLIKTAPYDGIVPLMEKLKALGYKLAVISNKRDGATREIAGRFFPGLLDLTVGERDGIKRKPAPDMVFAAAEELGLSLGECVFIGDSEVDFNTAKNAGVDCICVLWGFRDLHELKKAGAVVFANDVPALEKLILEAQ